MSNNVELKTKPATDFLQMLRPNGPWQLTAIWPEKMRLETQTFAKIEAVTKWLKERVGKANIYYTPNSIKASFQKKPEKTDMDKGLWLYVDLDYTKLPGDGKMSPEYQASEKARLLDTLEKKLPVGVPPPTVIVFTGGGYQALWQLAEPFPIDGKQEAWEQYERYNKWLTAAFKADHCWNVERILRLPGTANIPDAKKQKRGRITEMAKLHRFTSGAVYPLKALQQAPGRTGVAENPAPGIPGSIGIDAPKIDPTAARTLTKLEELDQWQVPDLCKMVIAQGNDPEEPMRFESGSEAQWYVTCELARCKVPDDLIYSIIADGTWAISGHVRRQKNPHSYALMQIAKAKEHAIDPGLEELNGRHFVIREDAGKCQVHEWKVDTDSDGRTRRKLISLSFAEFCKGYQHRRVRWLDKKGEEKSRKLGEWWLDHERRRQYDGLCFHPGGAPFDKQGRLNLWQGFAVQPAKGTWRLMKRHIWKVLANRDKKSFKYIVRWAAWALQNPDKPATADLAP